MKIRNDYLTIGDDHAPLKFRSIFKSVCPGSALFSEAATKILPSYIEEKTIQLIVKLYDKPREELLPGTLIHLGLEYDQPEKTLNTIKDLFETQSEWLEWTREIKHLLVNKYNLQEEEIEENTEISLSITAEAIQRKVKIVPTLFINNERQHFAFEDLEEELRTAIADTVEDLE